MARSIQLSLPSDRTDKLLHKLSGMEGLISLRVQKQISLQPKGDVLELELLNSEVSPFLKLLEDENLLSREDVSLTTSKPTSIISKASSDKLLQETHETSWEDILKNLLHQSNMNLSTLLVMFSAGIVAALGISTNSIHVVIGAMLVAPGFEPVSRAVMGLVSRNKDWKNGTFDIAKGYAALIAGGFSGAVILNTLGKNVLPGSASYLPAGVLVDYWMTISATSIIVSLVASFVGGLIIMANKSVLTAGVMVALALIPAGSFVGMWLFEGNLDLAGKAFLRLVLEIVIVASITGGVFLWKRFSQHSRDMKV